MADRPRNPRLRGRRTWPQRFLVSIGILAVTMCVLAASAVGYVYWKLGRLVRFDDLKVTEAAPGEPKNYLVVGSDSRHDLDEDDPDYGAVGAGRGAPDGKRSDTIMVLRIDPREEKAALLSVPRDLWVEISGTGRRDKINSAYNDGRQVLINTIQDNFGLDINHYVEVDFAGFKALVSVVGGVPLYFDTPMRDRLSGLDVESGCFRLDGSQALAFVRSRHLQYRNARGGWQTDPTSDLGRITRQQIFIRRAVKSAIARGLTNPATAHRLLNVGIDNVSADSELDTGDLLELAKRFKDFRAEDLETYSIPTETYQTNGVSAERMVRRQALPILNRFRGLPPDAVDEQDVQVHVRNGSGVSHQAAEARLALEAVGFQGGTTGDAGTRVARTIVWYPPGSEAAGELVARHLSAGAQLEPDSALDPNEVVLVTGDDFTTVMRRPRPPSTTSTTAATGSTDSTGSAPADGGGGATIDTTDTADSAPTTTSTVVGRAVGEPPPGTSCG